MRDSKQYFETLKYPANDIIHLATFSLPVKTQQIEGFVPKNAVEHLKVVGKSASTHFAVLDRALQIKACRLSVPYSQHHSWKNGQKHLKWPWKNGFLLRGRDSNPRHRAYGTLVLPLHNPTSFRCKVRASHLIQQILANLAKIWISGSIVATLQPQINW